MSAATVEETRPCPQCGEPAEPDQDGDVLLWGCEACLIEFGHHRVQVDDPSCQLGIPEDLRREYNGQPADPRVFVTIGPRPA